MDAKIQQFIASLVDEFQMDETRLNDMWKKIDTPADQVVPVTTTEKVEASAATNEQCTHIFTKGTKEGKKCTAKVAAEHGFCSKHTIPDENDKKLSLKKWEEILVSQIPEILVKHYKQEKDYLDGAKLTRETANNAAAWIMIKYETYFVHEDPADYYNGMVDFHEEMRDALMSSDEHPVDQMAKYFDDADDVTDEEYKKEYDCAKKMYASQYP